MIPIEFPQANNKFKAPPGLSEEQVVTISAYVGQATAGSCDGVPLVVTAWKPTDAELERLNSGSPVYLSVVGGLPPHFLSTTFEEAIAPA